VKVTDSKLAVDMKQLIATDLQSRYLDENRRLVLECCTFLDHRFKESFIGNAISVKVKLRAKLADVVEAHVGVSSQAAEEALAVKVSKKSEVCGLHGLLSSIKSAKSGTSTSSSTQSHDDSRSAEETFDSEEDPLAWWKGNEVKLAKK